MLQKLGELNTVIGEQRNLYKFLQKGNLAENSEEDTFKSRFDKIVADAFSWDNRLNGLLAQLRHIQQWTTQTEQTCAELGEPTSLPVDDSQCLKAQFDSIKVSFDSGIHFLSFECFI